MLFLTPRGRPGERLSERTVKLKEDAMDRCKWRKMMGMSEWVNVSSGTGLPR